MATPAILGIEDMSDFNPYYHTTDDQLQYLDMAYYIEFVKASIATFAHMSGCLIPGGIGALDGHVTAAGGGAPIAEATVTVDARTAMPTLPRPTAAAITPDLAGRHLHRDGAKPTPICRRS